MHLFHEDCFDFRVKGSSMSYFSTAILSMLEGYYVRLVCKSRFQFVSFYLLVA